MSIMLYSFRLLLIVIIWSAFLNLENQVVDAIKEISCESIIPYLAGIVSMVPYVVLSLLVSMTEFYEQ